MSRTLGRHDAAEPGLIRRWVPLCVAFLGSAIIVWAALHVLRQKPSAVAQPAPGPAAAAQTRPAGADLQKLVGDWTRADGDYTLRVRRIDPDGSADVEYRNPGLVRVGAASASLELGAPGLFVELRDTGYPGCTYRLIYSPSLDHLAGVYLQAGTGQRYEVAFKRR